jgi:hypothetical protein
MPTSCKPPMVPALHLDLLRPSMDSPTDVPES